MRRDVITLFIWLPEMQPLTCTENEKMIGTLNEFVVHFSEKDSLCNIEGVSDVQAFADEFGFSESLVNAMNKLDFLDRDILCYKYGAGYNAREIGRMLDKSADYVNKRLQRAEKKLAMLLENEDR